MPDDRNGRKIVPMRISRDDLILRDYQESYIEDEIRWTNTDTAWFYADTPWMELEREDPEELRREMAEILAGMKEDDIRWRLEIEVGGRHLGLVSSYFLNEQFQQPPWEAIDPSKNAVENRPSPLTLHTASFQTFRTPG